MVWNFYFGFGGGSDLHLEGGTIFNGDFHDFQFAQLFGIKKWSLLVDLQALLECLSKIIVFGFAFGANTVVYIHSL